MMNPIPPGVPTYPGPAWIHQDPRFQYGPSFDGLYSHGTQVNPYMNALFDDVNMMQHEIYSNSGVGYPPAQPYMPTPFPGGMRA